MSEVQHQFSTENSVSVGYGHRDLWNAEAERYSKAPTARFDDDGFLKILEASGVLTDKSRVLDLGCGPGSVPPSVGYAKPGDEDKSPQLAATGAAIRPIGPLYSADMACARF